MGVILMLMTIGGLMVAAIMLAVARIKKKRWLTKFTLGGVAIWFAFYAAMLVGFSIFSTERTLPMFEAKSFCGFYLDCHMHAAVYGVRPATTIGTQNAKGVFRIVKVRIFTDARRATLGLLTVDAHIVDSAGKQYLRDTTAESQLPPQPEFEKRVAPGEYFDKEIVFDLPPDVLAPRLDIREGYGIDHLIESLLVGDEDSIFHKRVLLDINEPVGAVCIQSTKEQTTEEKNQKQDQQK